MQSTTPRTGFSIAPLGSFVPLGMNAPIVKSQSSQSLIMKQSQSISNLMKRLPELPIIQQSQVRQTPAILGAMSAGTDAVNVLGAGVHGVSGVSSTYNTGISNGPNSLNTCGISSILSVNAINNGNKQENSSNGNSTNENGNDNKNIMTGGKNHMDELLMALGLSKQSGFY